jgi:hypothetical protein
LICRAAVVAAVAFLGFLIKRNNNTPRHRGSISVHTRLEKKKIQERPFFLSRQQQQPFALSKKSTT